MAMILIEDNHFAGYGYFDEFTELKTKEDFKLWLNMLTISLMQMIW